MINKNKQSEILMIKMDELVLKDSLFRKIDKLQISLLFMKKGKQYLKNKK